MKFLAVVLTAIAVLASTASSAQTAAMPDVGLFAPGDEWVWREIDNMTKLETSGRVNLIVEEKGVRKMVVAGEPRALTYPYLFEPSPKPWRVWPLEVGKQWTIDVDFVTTNGAAGNLKQDARVVAYEEVSVPAGKFMAFKIEHDGFVRNGNFNGRMVDTFWYAPEARADVKHIRQVGRMNFTRELVKYPALTGQQAPTQAPAAASAAAAASRQAQPPR